ncbi:Uncharacterised protein [Vibrio cholerae]|nr:Uncharacterised protein [Vibrio cholerae]
MPSAISVEAVATRAEETVILSTILRRFTIEALTALANRPNSPWYSSDMLVLRSPSATRLITVIHWPNGSTSVLSKLLMPSPNSRIKPL